jgi:hypothetical protein
MKNRINTISIILPLGIAFLLLDFLVLIPLCYNNDNARNGNFLCILFAIISIIFIIAGTAQLVSVLKMKKFGTDRKAMIVDKYFNIKENDDETNVDFHLILAYIDGNGQLAVRDENVGRNKKIYEIAYPIRTVVDIKELNEKIMLVSNRGEENIPYELSDAVDAYYEKYGCLKPNGEKDIKEREMKEKLSKNLSNKKD